MFGFTVMITGDVKRRYASVLTIEEAQELLAFLMAHVEYITCVTFLGEVNEDRNAFEAVDYLAKTVELWQEHKQHIFMKAVTAYTQDPSLTWEQATKLAKGLRTEAHDMEELPF